MAISKEQQTARTGKLGSSDAPRIMAGQWQEVWCEKTGRAAPPNLDLVPAVQIGVATEALHARFYTHKTGIECHAAGAQTFTHPVHTYLVAHLDFLTWSDVPFGPETPADTILEAKFHGGSKSDEQLAERYYWQVQHQMLVSGYRQAVLSILRPSSYSFLKVERNEGGLAKLLETLQAFWWHVENDFEPTDPSAVAPPPLDRLKIVDMTRHNAFTSLGTVLVENRTAFMSFRDAETALKTLMPDHARIAYLARSSAGLDDGTSQAFFLMRARDGKLSLRFGDLPRKYRDRLENWLPESAFSDIE